MRKQHLDLLALAPRPLKVLGANERSGNVAGMLMDITRDLAWWLFWAALGFEWAYIAVELAGAVQKRLPSCTVPHQIIFGDRSPR